MDFQLISRFFFSFFFLHRHNIYLVKRKDCNLVHAGMAATRTLWLACQNGGLFIEGKRKLRKGVVRTIELYCKHSSSCRVLVYRVLTLTQSSRTSLISLNSSQRSSRLIMFVSSSSQSLSFPLFDRDLSLTASLINSQVFQLQQPFCPSVSGRMSSLTSQGKCMDREQLLSRVNRQYMQDTFIL